jgi:nicotinamide mononucleotide transporter
MDIYSIVAFIFSMAYIILAIKGKRLCFLFGFLGSIVWAIADIFVYNLKFDFALNVFYAFMAIVGWFVWNQNNSEADERLKVNVAPLKYHFLLLCFGLLLSFFLVKVLSLFTVTNLPYLDALTTVFSVIGTFLLIKKFLENWLYFIVCNLCYLYIYGKEGAYLFMVTMIIYTILAMIGYVRWSKHVLKE